MYHGHRHSPQGWMNGANFAGPSDPLLLFSERAPPPRPWPQNPRPSPSGVLFATV